MLWVCWGDNAWATSLSVVLPSMAGVSSPIVTSETGGVLVWISALRVSVVVLPLTLLDGDCVLFLFVPWGSSLGLLDWVLMVMVFPSFSFAK